MTPRRVLVLIVIVLGALWLWYRPWVPGPTIPADRATSHPLPQDRPLRIVTMGTSLTASYDWPAVLQDRLSACLPVPVEITKVAKNGENIRWGAGQTAQVIDAEPDIVLIEYAINDADIFDGLSPRNARAILEGLIADLRLALPRASVVLATMSPAAGPRGRIRPRLAYHYTQYRDIAADNGIGLIDLYPRWLSRPPAQRGLELDGLHPDAEVVKAVILQPLTDYLGQTVGVSCSG